MSKALEGRVIVVTGGAAGIGFSTAQACDQEGARLALIDLKKADAEAAAAKLSDAKGYEANVTDPKALQAAIDAILQDFGQIDGLVNNAGIAGFGPVHEAELDDWERIMAVNVTGTFLASKSVLPDMLKRGSGAIVNFGSVAGMVGIPTMSAYCAAKGAIVNLTRQMAADYSGKGIRVNAVSPGTVASTEMGKSLLGDMSEELMAKRLQKYPIGRFGEPDDIADAVVFLLSDQAKFVSGSNLAVDGGMTAI